MFLPLTDCQTLLTRMIAAPGSDAEALLRILRADDRAGVAGFLATLDRVAEDRLPYLGSLLQLFNGNLAAAIDHMSAFHGASPGDCHSWVNSGTLLAAAADATQDKRMFGLAIQSCMKAWKHDPTFKPASDALRDFYRDRFNFAEKLLDKMGNKPRAVIEPTTYCHLKCRGCSRTIEDTPSIHMPLDRFQKIIDHLPPVSDIVMHGLGEPTLNKALPEMIGYAKTSGVTDTISFSTTGMQKDLTVYRRCFAAGLSYLRVSVDSLDPDIAEICRKGTNLEQVEHTIRTLVAEGYRVEVVTVVSKLNLADLEKTLMRLDTLGRFRVRGLTYLDKGDSAGTLAPHEMDEAIAIFNRARQNATQIEVAVLNQYATATDYTICAAISDITVDVGGYLSPCCHVYDRSIYHYLSLAEHSFEEIRRGQFMQDFIRRYVDQAPNFCGGCLMNNRPTERQSYPSTRQFGDGPAAVLTN